MTLVISAFDLRFLSSLIKNFIFAHMPPPPTLWNMLGEKKTLF